MALLEFIGKSKRDPSSGTYIENDRVALAIIRNVSALHLSEPAGNLRQIQKAMGHRSLKTIQTIRISSAGIPNDPSVLSIKWK